MPGLITQQPDRKRKRDDGRLASKTSKPRKASRIDGDSDIKSRIVGFETAISDSRTRDAAFQELLTVVEDDKQSVQIAVLAAVTACRAFARLISSQELLVAQDRKVAEPATVQKFFHRFVNLLISWVGDDDATKENTAVTLLMRLVKEEVHQETKQLFQAWRAPTSTFISLVRRLLQSLDAENARQLFIEKYSDEHDDVRYYTLSAIAAIAKEEDTDTEVFAANALDMLSQIGGIPETQEQLEDWYGQQPQGTKNTLLSLSAHRKTGVQAWLALFSSPLTLDQRKHILGIMNAQILPWFPTRLEVLTDFLTDSFNNSGSTAVLALGGLFHLITQRNMDYPDFYKKLYSLLDHDVLQSKHRSYFLRLLDRCMSSSHLPAVLVASFVKRLSRLALQASPGAIVWIVPWIYNILRHHPSCTYMIHRQRHPAHVIWSLHPDPAETGMQDPFNMLEPDPMLTRALESSLWELETLRSHYHPNVATLASIIGEQFTKREYQLEDFLDHSYATLLDVELGRELKKEPVIEYQIPKLIITTEGVAAKGLNKLGSMLHTAITMA